MSKISKKQQEKLDQVKQEKFQNTVRMASDVTQTETFSCKVGSATKLLFIEEIKKYNEKNPHQKLKIGKVLDQLMYDFYKDLKVLNTDEEQQELDL